MVTPLVALYRAHTSTDEVPDESQLDALWRLGCSAWPGIEISAQAFVLHLAATRASDETLDEWRSSLHAAELYLACACAAGVERAIVTFNERYLSQVGAFLVRLRPQPALVEDIRQVLRERLFVGAAPKILEYSGRGALGNWLRVVTVRTALNMIGRRTELLDGLGSHSRARDAESARLDPELDYIREHYRGAFELAFEASVAALSSEQRNLLRLHFIQGVSLDGLARLFHVYRATIARRIAQARVTIVEQAREDLRRRLSIELADFNSLMGLLASRLELSMTRLLDSSSAGARGLADSS